MTLTMMRLSHAHTWLACIGVLPYSLPKWQACQNGRRAKMAGVPPAPTLIIATSVPQVPAQALEPNGTNPLGLDPMFLAAAYYGSMAWESEMAEEGLQDPNSKQLSLGWPLTKSAAKAAVRSCCVPVGPGAQRLASVEVLTVPSPPDLPAADPQAPATAASGSLESYLCELGGIVA